MGPPHSSGQLALRPGEPGLDGKVAIVTGASRGIGRAIARRLADGGASVVAVARSPDLLTETCRLVQDVGGTCLARTADVTQPEAFQEIVREVVESLGGVDILVNNAGCCLRGSLPEVTLKEYDAMIAVNVNAVLYCSRSVWEHMRERGGVIVNVSSLVTTWPTPGFPVYAATKGFVNTLTSALAAEGRRDGIRVYGIAPGYVETDLFRATSPEVPEDKALHPEEVAAAVAVLCGRGYRHSSGSVLSMRR